MNRYKITATRSNGTKLSDYFIEATEGAARKVFKECYRNEEYSDVKVELVAEYVQATKEQEREALAKIVKIIEGLGPGSYVGIAFEGCFKDTEDNIENDFGCSMKQKLESAETRLADAEERLKELGGLIAKLKEERKALEEKLAKQSLPEWLRFDLHALAAEDSAAARKRMEESAEIMAETADKPRDIAFKEAVESYPVPISQKSCRATFTSFPMEGRGRRQLQNNIKFDRTQAKRQCPIETGTAFLRKNRCYKNQTRSATSWKPALVSS